MTSNTAAPSTRFAQPYVAVSRMRADRDLVEQAGVQFCREQQVTPLRREGDTVLVATARPGGAPAWELERRLRAPVVLVPASAAEIGIALALAIEGVAPPRELRRALAAVLEATRLLPAAVATAYVHGAEDEPYLGATLVQSGHLSEDERLEAAGLAFHLPSVVRAHLVPAPGLRAVVEAIVGPAGGWAPLWVLGHDLVLACVDPPPLATLERIERGLALRPRPLLVSPAVFEALPVDAPRAPAGGTDILDLAQRAGLVQSQVLAEAVRVAAQSGEPLLDVASRLSGTTAEALRGALARAMGTPVIASASEIDADAAVLLPRPLAEHLGAVPVQRDRHSVTVASADPWDASLRHTMEAMLGVTVRPALLAVPLPEALAVASGHAAPSAPADPALALHLLTRLGFFDPERAAEIGVEVDHPTAATVDGVIATLDETEAAEATAVLWELPRIDVLVRHPDPAAPDHPTGWSVLLDGEVLTAAVTSIEATRSQVARVTRYCITPASTIAEARQAFSTVDLHALALPLVELGRDLELAGALDRPGILKLWERVQAGRPVDLALFDSQQLTPAEINSAFAEVVHETPARLARYEVLQAASAAGGVQRILTDPVDHAVARLLSHDDARRLGAVPYALEEGALAIAIADPLDAAVGAELTTMFGGECTFHPATRYEIVEAGARAHGRPSIGELLLDSALITPDELASALQVAQRTGVPLAEALLSLGATTEEQIAQHLARQHGMAFVSLRGVDLDAQAGALLPEAFVREHYVLPLAVEADGEVLVAIDDPDDVEGLAETQSLLGARVRFAVTTHTDIRDALERLYSAQYLETSAIALRMHAPENSAYRVLSTGQKVFLIGMSVLLVGLGLVWTVPTLTVVLSATTAFYVTLSLYKFYLIIRSLSHDLGVTVTDEQVAAMEDRDLPTYTVLVPLYHEANVLPALVRSLQRLDYPEEKLDVKLLLEEDDVETIAVARAFNLPKSFDITIVPNGLPKGKPKACNYGLLHARGSYVVIFDAEDVPDPDQLKKALIAFASSPPSVVCVQARLSYFNRDQNVLTRWFTAEYALWFDLFLPGLDASGAPIPLGGTSNHFKREALEAVHAWDPFNVTEDADLGLRIFKLGGGTVVVNSTTYEEATSVVDNWIRQRSRWVKGYIQTYLVHMRHPLELWRSLGTNAFISFQLVIGGTVFSFLFNPVLWMITGIWFATKWSVIQEVFPTSVYYIGAISLYAGNFAFAYMNVAGCLRRGYYSLVKWALLTPIYWVLMSIAAWKGFLQLFYKPFYWEKTVHGLSDQRSREDLSRLTSGQ